MLRSLRRALRPGRARTVARRFTAEIAELPPSARDALGLGVTAGEAIAYNRSRVATATAIDLHFNGYGLPVSDDLVNDAVHALDFPYSVPSPATRAAVRAALGVLEAGYTFTTTR